MNYTACLNQAMAVFNEQMGADFSSENVVLACFDTGNQVEVFEQFCKACFPVVWRQTAELCARFLTKGRKCAVVGQLQTRSYDAQDGTKRYVTEVVADEVEFLGGPQNSSNSYNPGDVPPPPEPSSSYTSNTGFTQVDDDELPF